jgi:hypothetical protein
MNIRKLKMDDEFDMDDICFSDDPGPARVRQCPDVVADVDVDIEVEVMMLMSVVTLMLMLWGFLLPYFIT